MLSSRWCWPFGLGGVLWCFFLVRSVYRRSVASRLAPRFWAWGELRSRASSASRPPWFVVVRCRVCLWYCVLRWHMRHSMLSNILYFADFVKRVGVVFLVETPWQGVSTFRKQKTLLNRGIFALCFENGSEIVCFGQIISLSSPNPWRKWVRSEGRWKGREVVSRSDAVHLLARAPAETAAEVALVALRGRRARDDHALQRGHVLGPGQRSLGQELAELFITHVARLDFAHDILRVRVGIKRRLGIFSQSR